MITKSRGLERHYSNEFIMINNCHCVSHSHSRGFYGRVGFEEMDTDEGSKFLGTRLAFYRTNKELDMVMLKRPLEGNQAASNPLT
jgi:hypothetical protein